MLAAPFVVGALGLSWSGPSSGDFTPRRSSPMLGTYALRLIIREIVRGLIGGLYLSVPEPLGGSVNIGTMHFSTWRLVIILITALVMIGSYLTAGAHRLRVANSGVAGRIRARPRIGHFDQCDLWRDLRVRRRTRKALRAR